MVEEKTLGWWEAIGCILEIVIVIFIGVCVNVVITKYTDTQGFEHEALWFLSATIVLSIATIPRALAEIRTELKRR